MTEEKKHVPELRFPEFEGEWRIITLGEATIKIGSGKTPLGGSSVYLNKGIPFLRSQNVQYGILDLSELVYIDENTDENMKNSRTYYGDILLNITGASIGRSTVNTIKEGYANLNQHVCIIRLKEHYNYNFIGQFLISPKGQKRIFMAQSGGSREGLNFNEISKIKFNLPDEIEEQQKIGNFFSKLDRQIELEEEKLALLEEQKKGYMQKIFSQELRFKDENGEEYPAWEEQKLDNIANIGTGKSKVKNTGGNYDVLGSTGIIGKSNNYDYEGDFILIARVGHYAGSLYKYSGKVNITDNTIYLKSNIVLEFIYYSLKRYRISRLVFGSGQPLLKSSDIKQLKLFISGEKEQQKIGDFFSKLDRHIELQGKKIELLKQRKQGFLQKMFV
ncbi:restriction endonuclease subunit S [Staphylococcus delphini]|uniref:restriction endonuclease subunit S n=1 Tax=Staphylococcus delphini TaxID=53344 RepID=UPI0023B305D0|nr:restriction endonuclease subunit S [Staphylococcus delphini]MDE9799251.1 restriction endonuclease subunit S [Staphylococcus delphini]MDE9806033.1 restriction endonuclease subunit S [Staphylococcus delphini]